MLHRFFLIMVSGLFIFASATDSADAAPKKRHQKPKATPAAEATEGATSTAPRPSASQFVGERLKRALETSGFKNGEVGLWVGATEEGKGLATYFSHNDDKLFIPASLSKLITAGAILHELHPSYKFKTMLVSDAKIENGLLAGPIYLKGGGDPSFVSENAWFLVNELSRSGITSVEGDVIVDDTRYDKIRFGDDRQEERVDRAYDAPVGAMSMNWNSVTTYVRPGDKVGDKAKVFADVMSPYLKVRNETRTVAAGKGKSISIERTKEKGFDGDVVIASGSIALEHPEVIVYKNISDPEMWAGMNLIEFLRQRGIMVKGKVRSGTAPKEAVVLAVSESKVLSSVLADMGKWSNNYVAEMLVKEVSADAGDTPATMAGGMAKVTKYLESAGIKKGEYEFHNAAGFTRKNKLTPGQMGRYMEHVHSDFSIFPEYVAALPIAGVDGTLRKRMVGQPAERWVRAKTGLLNGVVGLAGFAGRADSSVLTFVFIYNGSGREDKARAFFDRMASILVED
jgi:D-alanyl-D-alanine carboxypeptidase/D-alanyl-D-alanine-endopeptidase (penicillin-binding protein 4)